MSEHQIHSKENDSASVSRARFLKDVLICSLGAYGGPEAHISIFLDQLVTKRRYLQEEELLELVALCSILPGPTSTQTIVSVGYRQGGPWLAFLTMLVWAAPVLLTMTLLSFGYDLLSRAHISTDVLRFVGPMAVGFIILAAIRIGRKVVVDKLTVGLMLFSAIATYFIRTPWIFPLVLLVGGTASIVASGETGIWNRPRISPPWRFFVLFAGIAIGLLLATFVFDAGILRIFESFYRYGYLVFGGGQVVVPVMHSELVELRSYMTNEEFLTGYGLVQGLPGPMFSFAAYAGGLAARGGSVFHQALGAAAGGIGIFLPGLLLVYFVYPIWTGIRQMRAVKLSLKGINAVAGGMIAVAAVILLQKNGFSPVNVGVSVSTAALLATRIVPAPLIVAVALGLGTVFS